MKKMYDVEQLCNDILPSVRKGKTIAQCHGVFDLVHPGHVVYLKQAKAMADILIVSVTTAEYVNKEPWSPYFDDLTRMENLAALECVDYVVLSKHPTAVEVLDMIRPDLFIKGSEYASAANDATGGFKKEKDLVESYGGKVCFTKGKVFSSTKLIDTFLRDKPAPQEAAKAAELKGRSRDKLNLDSHKLIYHPKEVGRWLDGEEIYPIEIEISPSGACNHRCVFCAYDYVGYKPQFLDGAVIMRDIRLMREKGLKSVVCSGEGEPLLNPHFINMVQEIYEIGVNVAMSTNAALFTKEKAEQCLPKFTWIRFSVASLNENSYYKIQRAPEGDLKRVRQNIADAVRIKHRTGAHTTLGVQCLLMRENRDDVADMVKQCRDMGVDYISIKPYSNNIHSFNHFTINYDEMLDLEQEIRRYETDDFAVSFRVNAMRSLQEKKPYPRCLGLPFMTHIDASGNVWPCSPHIGDMDYFYGNIYEQTFEEIWEGEKRKEAIKRLWSRDIETVCRRACRLDAINQYLQALTHPSEHVNFI